ncbi:MAG TPA: DUF3592 domain-containing protein [Chitinophagaceae bacterium]
MDTTDAILISASVAVAGLIPLLIAIYKHRRYNMLLKTGIPSTGLVEETYQRRGLKGNTYYYAAIAFPLQDRSIQRVNYHFMAARTQSIFQKGSTVSVIYNPANPKRYIIKEVPQSKALIIITIIIAVLYVVFGFLIFDFIRQ